jgi:hypothetical protein
MLRGSTLETWKAYLREDCRHRHKLLIVENANVLQALWSSGVEPTVQDIIDHADCVSHLDPSTLMSDSPMWT